MLITKKLTIKWAYKTSKHYKRKGYTFTKFGDYFEISLSDLYGNATFERVIIRCDYCGDEFDLSYQKYLTNQKKFYKDACHKCKHERMKEIFANRKDAGEIVKKSNISYEEIRQRFIDLKVIPMFEDAPGVLMSSKLPFICPIHEDVGIQYRMAWVRPHVSSLCVYCNMIEKRENRRIPISEIKTLIEDKNCTMTDSEYVDGKSRINFICNIHQDKGTQNVGARYIVGCDDICIYCRKANRSGENHPNWAGGITRERNKERNDPDYISWQNSVLIRDKYTCQCCGKKGNRLNVHHLYQYAKYKCLRRSVQNGITLCEECHLPHHKNSFHNLYGTQSTFPEDLYEYIQRYQSGEFENKE